MVADAATDRRSRRSWPAFLDGATDGLLVLFAAWTLLYEVLLAAQVDVRWTGYLLVPLGVAAVVAGGLLEVRRADRSAVPSRPADPVLPRLAHLLWPAGLALLAVLVAARGPLGVAPFALVGGALLVVQLVPWWRAHRPARAVPDPVPESPAPPAPWHLPSASPVEHLLALAASLGLAVLAAVLLRPDADDAFYVNRATWVAEHGTAALHDTMFGPDRYPSTYGGGLPTPSVETLQGVLAHLLSVDAATFVYQVFAPAMAFVAGWVTWRLVREWAPRRPGLVLLVALLFVLASGASVVGNYSVGRIWQGKVTAYVVLLPLVWLHLGRAATPGASARARRGSVLLLTAAGVAFVGLSTTSSLLAPVVAAAGLLAALVLRSRTLALGSAGFLLAPVVNGLVALLGPAAVGDPDATPATPADAFAICFGAGTAMAVLGVVGLVGGVAVLRGPLRVVAACGSAAVLAALLPGVLTLADAFTGAGPVVWRMLLATPVWVLVGMLAAAPLPDLSAVPSLRLPSTVRVGVVVAVVVALLAVPLAAGRWQWSSATGARVTSGPTWKVDQRALRDVRAAERLDVRGRGLWLLPPLQMQVLAISDTRRFTVVPRAFYLPHLDVDTEELQDRQALLRLTSGGRVRASVARSALDRLDVSLACVPGTDDEAREVLAEAVGDPLRRVGRMRCHVADG